MNLPVIAFFNNKGGVGKTSLVYHLAWMYADLGIPVVAADLDPQANLTAACLPDDQLEDLFESHADDTVFGCIRPLLDGTGDISQPKAITVSENLFLLAGDLSLSGFEDELSYQWAQCLDRKPRAFRVISAFWRLMQNAADACEARFILVDLAPNLGAINRAALVAADYVVVPLSPDLFSLKGLENLGPTVRRWRGEWNERLHRNPLSDLHLPTGSVEPLGYIVLQHSVRLDRPVKAYNKWINRIPNVYRSAVLDQSTSPGVTIMNDPHCLAMLKHYRSLMPMAQEVNKPIFHLKPADGAIGAHATAVNDCYRDFEKLARAILDRANLTMPWLGENYG